MTLILLIQSINSISFSSQGEHSLQFIFIMYIMLRYTQNTCERVIYKHPASIFHASLTFGVFIFTKKTLVIIILRNK